MIALVKKLPKEILDYFHRENNLKNLMLFTERKLRPLTLMDSDEIKIRRFKEIIKEYT